MEVSFYAVVLDNCSDGIYFVDKERKITYWNKTAEHITGYEAVEVLGRFCQDNILRHIDENGTCLCENGCPLHSTIKDGEIRNANVFLHHKKGHRLPVSVRTVPYYEQGRIVGAIEYFTDESQKHDLLESVEKYSILAMTDELTSLPNRRLLDAFLESKYLESRQFCVEFGIALFDLDFFKAVNDNYGHTAGDLVLQAVSKTCSSVCRKSDIFGRWGGEEFLAVYVGVNENSLKRITEKLRMLIENTVVSFEGHDISVTASAGATMFSKVDTIESAVKRADELLYASKQKGKNCVTVG